MHVYLEGTNITENAVINIILCQRNLEHVESEFLSSALTKLMRDNIYTPSIDLQNNNEYENHAINTEESQSGEGQPNNET